MSATLLARDGAAGSMDSGAELHSLDSPLLGRLDFSPDELLRLPHGLLGLPDCHDYLLVRAEREGLYWLQSVEEAALTFVLTDPFLFFEGYSVEVGAALRRELGEPAASDLLVLAIVTLPRSATGRPTANLQGPLAFNLATRIGRQIPLGDSPYGVREPFTL